jgi:hypothetical protein
MNMSDAFEWNGVIYYKSQAALDAFLAAQAKARKKEKG